MIDGNCWSSKHVFYMSVRQWLFSSNIEKQLHFTKKFMIDFKVVFANSSLTNLVYKNIKSWISTYWLEKEMGFWETLMSSRGW